MCSFFTQLNSFDLPQGLKRANRAGIQKTSEPLWKAFLTVGQNANPSRVDDYSSGTLTHTVIIDRVINQLAVDAHSSILGYFEGLFKDVPNMYPPMHMYAELP